MNDELRALLRDRVGVTDLAVIPNRYAPEGFRFSCGGSEAVDRWRSLRAIAGQSGFWPVILGDDKEVERILGVADSEYGQPLETILKDAFSRSAERWLKEREKLQRGEIVGDPDAFLASLHEEWPAKIERLTQFTIPYDGLKSKRPKDKITIGLFPTMNPWELPAYLNFGGWNECPDPSAHVRLMKRWYDEYGAELVGMNGDEVEMYATRPPITRQDALRLAKAAIPILRRHRHPGNSDD
jgi:hypothetical protein